MDEVKKIIKGKRRKLKWSTKELAERADVPHSAVLRIERGTGKWPDYISSINAILDKELNINRQSSYSTEQEKEFSYESHEDNKEPTAVSKYYVNINDIDLNVYFPNLSEGEYQRLFGYSKKQMEQKNNDTIPKIKFRPIGSEHRLARVFKHSVELLESFPIKNRKIPKEYFTPNFNPIACKWFEIFDNVNNTQGLYATRGGEFYIEELGFFPDYFNPKLKLIMEWDEAHHFINGELSLEDVERQKAIQKLFPHYEFVRIKEADVKDYLDL